jgi:hypothetical protein
VTWFERPDGGLILTDPNHVVMQVELYEQGAWFIARDDETISQIRENLPKLVRELAK